MCVCHCVCVCVCGEKFKKCVFFQLHWIGLHEVLGLYANIWMLQDIPVIPKIGPSQIGSSAKMETKGTAEGDRAGGEVPQSSSTLKDVQKDWSCALGLVTTSSEEILNSHFSGGKHRAALQKQKDEEVINETTTTDNKEIVKVKFRY
jgi:hypothetical protein